MTTALPIELVRGLANALGLGLPYLVQVLQMLGCSIVDCAATDPPPPEPLSDELADEIRDASAAARNRLG